MLIGKIEQFPENVKEIKNEWMVQFAERTKGEQKVQIMDGKDFDSVPGRILFRGIEHQKFLKENLGDFQSRWGIHGGGSYFASGGAVRNLGLDAIAEAGGYAKGAITKGGGSWVYVAKLLPEARTVDEPDLTLMRQREKKSRGRKLSPFLEDLGRFALVRGFDAIRVPYEKAGMSEHVVVVNKKILAVDARSLPDGEFGKMLFSQSVNPFEILKRSEEIVRNRLAALPEEAKTKKEISLKETWIREFVLENIKDSAGKDLSNLKRDGKEELLAIYRVSYF